MAVQVLVAAAVDYLCHTLVCCWELNAAGMRKMVLFAVAVAAAAVVVVVVCIETVAAVDGTK